MQSTVVQSCALAVLTALAGLSVRPAAAQSTTLVPPGAVWRFVDSGSDLGGAWHSASYDDSFWPSGPAKLGFGEGDEATLLSVTNAVGSTNITYYFRTPFTVSDPSRWTNLVARLRRDDGAAVYLNDVEVFRSNLPTGPLLASTLALAPAVEDGQDYFATLVNPALLRAGDNVLAVEVHQAAQSGGDLTFDFTLQANVGLQRPQIALVSPTNGPTSGAANLSMTTQVSDPDGVVVLVDFLADGIGIGSSLSAPFSLVYSNITAGTHVLQAIALDNFGLTSTSAPVTVTVPARLVASGAGWRYLDTGADPGADWAGLTFDDSGWSNGVAQFGFGRGDEATLVRRVNSLTGTNIVTYYFRRAFDLPSVAGMSNLVLRLVRDDGAVVFLNGSEVQRINMPAGPVTASTLASQAVGSDPMFHATRVNPGLLLAGRNVIAVEMHQFNLTSSDLGFDLELRPNVPFSPPSVALVAPADSTVLFGPTNVAVAALADDFDQPITSVAVLVDGVVQGTDLTDSYEVDGRNFGFEIPELAPGNHLLRAVATDAGGLSATSAPVALTVTAAAISSTLIATGTVWRYWDLGVDQGTAWCLPGFDDSGWKTGRAKFGNNDPATTPIDLLPVNENITTYFRQRFAVNNAAAVTNLAFRVLRDDGVVAWLNGVEIFRNNMPTGAVDFATYALLSVGGTNEVFYLPISTGARLLVNGENVLAVELHQVQTVTTVDAGFDLSLVGLAAPGVGPPVLHLERSGGGVLLSWDGAAFTLQDASSVKGPFTNRVSGTNRHVVPNLSGNRFFRLVR